MSSEKDPRLGALEHSLIHFLCQKGDIEQIVSGGSRRVRSLSFGLKQDNSRIVFYVQLGICEATFETIYGVKVRGNCFGLERYIRDWYERPSVQHEVRSLIRQLYKDTK